LESRVTVVRLAVLVALAIALLAACGEHEQAPLPTLPAAAVPELESSAQEVDLGEVLADFGGEDDFEGKVEGFVRGRERVFQGESQRFDRVVSRTLEFEDAAAAEGYVGFLRGHLDAVYGVGTTTERLESKGRDGFLIDTAACACHRAEPTLAAVVSRGPRVTFLEVNGGGAKPAAVEELLALAP
jgi:hypothetical protein